MTRSPARFLILWRRSKGIRRYLMALAIAYAFLVVLMTASLQLSVAERLADLEPPQDYSSAYATWQQGDHFLGSEIRRLKGERGELLRNRQTVERQHVDQGDNILGTEARLRALRQRLRGAAECGFAERGEFQMHEMPEAISLLRQCLRDPTVPPPARAELNAFLEEHAEGLEAAARRFVRLGRQLENLDSRIRANQEALAELEREQDDYRRIANSFADLSGLQRPWLGAGLIAAFPPPVVQILLSFISGVFGALLVTLVLLVYPNSRFDPNSDRARYGARLLLGGLIAVCVFIVLGGGTAVLGADEAFAEGEVNYLAFCAIGILAGMFSDRVAHWLSVHANELFGADAKSRDEGASPPDQTGVSVTRPSR